MKSSTLIILLVLGLVAVIAFFSIPSGQSDEEFIKAVIEERAEKESYMKESPESPFVHEEIPFNGLHYFEPSRKYVVKARLTPVENPKVRVLPTSSGESSSYLEYSWAEFELDGVQNRLLILEARAAGPARGMLFLAFADGTSARESYGGGRYLDLKKIPGASSIELDFNQAYNPYCAYTDGYSCPLPPAENILKIAISAGEKNYDH